MGRKQLAAFAVALLILLSGCSFPTTVGLEPVVESVEGGNESGYRIHVTAALEEEVVETTFSEVSVSGYSLTGERLCEQSYGNVSTNTTRTLSCEQLPSLLVVHTPDIGERVQSGRWLNDLEYTVVTYSKLYRGKRNGSHEYRHRFGRISVDSDRYNVTLRDAVPSTGLLQEAKCVQWGDTQREPSADYSALGDKPWLSWEKQPPNSPRVYELNVYNYTHLNETGQTHIAPINNSTARYGFSAVHPEIRTAVRSAEQDSNLRDDRHFVRLNRATFGAIIESLSSVELGENWTAREAVTQVPGATRTYDDTHIDCWKRPPKYDGDRGSWGQVVVVDGDSDRRWVVQVRTEQHYRGNVTLGSTTNNSGKQTSSPQH